MNSLIAYLILIFVLFEVTSVYAKEFYLPYLKEYAGVKNISESTNVIGINSSFRRIQVLYKDSIDTDSNLTNYKIPDSIKKSFSEDEIGLRVFYPNNWKKVDQREINKNEKEFKGVLFIDTTAKDELTMLLVILNDKEGKSFRKDDFRTVFKMEDATLVALSTEPSNVGVFTMYNIYIFGKVEKLLIGVQIKTQFYNEYNEIIKAVVTSINID